MSTFPTLRESVAVADPNNPNNVIKPNADGSINVVGGGGGGGGTAADQTGSNASDGQATSTTNQHTVSYNYLWNGTTWDRAKGTGGAANVLAAGPTAEGTAPAQPPIYNGFKDAGGLTRGASPTTRFPAHDYDQRATSQTLSSAAGSFIDIPLDGCATVGLRFAGLTASGATISYFISNDATQTPVDTVSSLNAATGVTSSTRTTDGSTRIAVGGHTTLRLQVTTGGTGSITVSWNTTAAGSIFDLRSPLPAGANTIGSIGNTSFGATQSGAWNVALLAGSAKIGVVTTDQTTHGTTDKVAADLYVAGALATNANPAPTALQTGSTMTTSQPSVTTTAAALTFAGSVRRSIYNPASNTASIFIGGSSSVTTGNGWEIPPGASEDVSRFTGAVYAIAASSQTVRVISY